MLTFHMPVLNPSHGLRTIRQSAEMQKRAETHNFVLGCHMFFGGLWPHRCRECISSRRRIVEVGHTMIFLLLVLLLFLSQPWSLRSVVAALVAISQAVVVGQCHSPCMPSWPPRCRRCSICRLRAIPSRHCSYCDVAACGRCCVDSIIVTEELTVKDIYTTES